MNIKNIAGWCVLIFYGFLVFVAMSATGFAIGIIFHLFAWWHITLGTILGVIMVVIYLWDKV
jgi:hypothetical protein